MLKNAENCSAAEKRRLQTRNLSAFILRGSAAFLPFSGPRRWRSQKHAGQGVRPSTTSDFQILVS
jgi:hypothetical protein